MTEIIDLVRQINELTKRETAVIHAMASLPEPERVQFLREQFTPLAAEEHRIAQETGRRRRAENVPRWKRGSKRERFSACRFTGLQFVSGNP